MFCKRYVLIPINEEWHWSLIVLCNLDTVRRFVLRNDNIPVPVRDNDQDPILIVHLDSLGTHNTENIACCLRNCFASAIKFSTYLSIEVNEFLLKNVN